MGTKAILKIKQKETLSTCIGVVVDGFPDNLVWIADKFEKTARSMKILTNVKRGYSNACIDVMNEMCEDDDWMFTSLVKDTCWLSYIGVYSPKECTVNI